MLLTALIQVFCARLDDWATEGLFEADGSKSLMWLILGLGNQPELIIDAKKVYLPYKRCRISQDVPSGNSRGLP